jgi:hypothetical protein
MVDLHILLNTKGKPYLYIQMKIDMNVTKRNGNLPQKGTESYTE